MCGIFCSISTRHHVLPDNEIRQRLEARGPDSSCTIQATFRNVRVTLCSTVLSLRGSTTVAQPYQDPEEKYTLCWNGEAWSIGGKPTLGNDTEAVHKLLVDALDSTTSMEVSLLGPSATATLVAEALSQVTGPYAFVFFDHVHGRLYLVATFWVVDHYL